MWLLEHLLLDAPVWIRAVGIAQGASSRENKGRVVPRAFSQEDREAYTATEERFRCDVSQLDSSIYLIGGNTFAKAESDLSISNIDIYPQHRVDIGKKRCE